MRRRKIIYLPYVKSYVTFGACVLLLCFHLPPAAGQVRPDSTQAADSISRFFQMPLAEALQTFALEQGIAIAFTRNQVAGKISQCATSDGEIDDILRCLVQGTDLTIDRTSAGTYILKNSSADVQPTSPHKDGPRKTISGFVLDAETGEKLIGANLYVPNLRTGTVTNNYGFYSLTLPADSVYLAVSYLGFETQYFHFLLMDDVARDFRLKQDRLGLGNIEVLDERIENLVQSTQMGIVNLPIEQVRKLPAFMGERDIIKPIQLLPGVQSGREGSTGLYVRGGGPDQNLILLDGAPVYNVSHLFGFFSVFNDDALHDVTLIKGGFPSRYGGRLSSVLDISMKEGNNQHYEAHGALGLISSKLTIEGPIKTDRMSFIVSGRRTYIDLLARPFLQDQGDFSAYFYDLNAKLNFTANRNNRFYLSFYSGRDAFGGRTTENYKTTDGADVENNFAGRLSWGNQTATFRWNHVYGRKLFSNTAFNYSQYDFDTQTEVEDIVSDPTPARTFNKVSYSSGIEDISGKIDFDYRPNPDHYIRFGAGVIRHSFSPGIGRFQDLSPDTTPIDTTITANTRRYAGVEYSTYVEDDLKAGERLKLNIGAHFSGFAVNGVNYTALQPRLSLRYLLNPKLSLKASFITMQQYLHLLSNSGANLPTDLWVASTDRVKPQTSWQGAAGVSRLFGDGGYEFSIEGYYKHMDNLIEYAEAASYLQTNRDWQDKIEMGEGWSYGVELFIQKKTGKTTGWIGYTLSRTDRKFPNLNNGRAFPYRYDRRHDISATLAHELRKNLDIGMTWVYGTGNAVTLATARYYDGRLYQNGYVISEHFYYGGRNAFRERAYHRLDLALNWHRQRSLFTRRGTSTLTVGVYNVYNRKNPFFMYPTTNDEGKELYKHVSLFPILPSVSYYFHF